MPKRPVIEDEIFLKYPHITSPEEMKHAIWRDYQRECTASYARQRMEELGMDISRASEKRKPSAEKLTDDYFMKHHGAKHPREIDMILRSEYSIKLGPKKARSLVFRERSRRGGRGVSEGMVISVLEKRPDLDPEELSKEISSRYPIRMTPRQANWWKNQLIGRGIIKGTQSEYPERPAGPARRKRGRRPLVRDEDILGYSTGDPCQMADDLSKRYGKPISPAYVARKMRNLKIKVRNKKFRDPSAGELVLSALQADSGLSGEELAWTVNETFKEYGLDMTANAAKVWKSNLRAAGLEIPKSPGRRMNAPKPDKPTNEEMFLEVLREDESLEGQEYADAVNKRYDIKATPRQARIWRTKLSKRGLVKIKEPERKERRPAVLRRFFEKHPNERYEAAVSILERDFSVTGITKRMYSYYRRKYRGRIKGMRNLRRKIPAVFFKHNPSAEYSNETLEELKKYGVDWEVTRLEFVNRKARLAERLHLGSCRARKIPASRKIRNRRAYHGTRSRPKTRAEPEKIELQRSGKALTRIHFERDIKDGFNYTPFVFWEDDRYVYIKHPYPRKELVHHKKGVIGYFDGWTEERPRDQGKQEHFSWALPKRTFLPAGSDPRNRAVTEGMLATVIQNSIMNGMESNAARGIARHVLNFFGAADRIIDNVLEPEDRDAFYMLEDAGILATEREETMLYDGREWRIHYWLFKRDRFFELLEGQRKPLLEDSSVYESMPSEAWERSSAPRHAANGPGSQTGSAD